MSAYQTVDPGLLGLADQLVRREKQAFVPGGGDPAMGGMPPGGDPAAMGSMPPGGDPAAMGGMPPGGDPAAMGGAPPPGGSDPTAGVQGGAPDITKMIQDQVQAALQGMGGAGGPAGAAQLKPKIDQNVTMLQILKILAKIADALHISIPASEMVTTPEDLQQMAEGGPGAAAVTPDSGPQADLLGQGPIAPIQQIGNQKMGAAMSLGVAERFGPTTVAAARNRDTAAAIRRTLLT